MTDGYTQRIETNKSVYLKRKINNPTAIARRLTCSTTKIATLNGQT